MADFPRIKWLNIDGQQVPFTEPQHFTGNGDETVRTGHDNPLPVANYTQNDSGIWMPVSKSNPVPTQVTGRNVEQLIYDVDRSKNGLYSLNYGAYGYSSSTTNYKPIDGRKFGNYYLHVSNDTDTRQTAIIRSYYDLENNRGYYSTVFSEEIPAGATLNSIISIPLYSFSVRVEGSTANIGNVTVVLNGGV